MNIDAGNWRKYLWSVTSGIIHSPGSTSLIFTNHIWTREFGHIRNSLMSLDPGLKNHDRRYPMGTPRPDIHYGDEDAVEFDSAELSWSLRKAIGSAIARRVTPPWDLVLMLFTSGSDSSISDPAAATRSCEMFTAPSSWMSK